jgi:probable rRNA maturation factor
MTADAPALDITIEDEAWDEDALQAAAAAGAGLAMRAAGLPATGWSVSLLATDDARIAALNHAFRGKTEPTNVLSWPASNLTAETPGARPAPPPKRPKHLRPGETQELGDIAVARETVAREAQERGISVRDHLTHLIMHGVLHLLGYDHGFDADAALMEGLERKALAEAGLHDPYEKTGAD